MFVCFWGKNKKEDQVTGCWECSFILEAEKFGRAELSDELWDKFASRGNRTGVHCLLGFVCFGPSGLNVIFFFLPAHKRCMSGLRLVQIGLIFQFYKTLHLHCEWRALTYFPRCTAGSHSLQHFVLFQFCFILVYSYPPT